MAMDREDFRDEVRENIKRTVTAFSNDRINRHLNWAKDYIADLHTFEEMRKKYTASTIQDTKAYGFPVRMKDIYSITLQDGASSRPLIYVNAREFDTKVPRPEIASTGRSNWYVDYGINFELYRIPDAVYPLNLRCSTYPSDFADDNATSDLTRKDALITAIATVFGFWTLRELEDAAFWGREMVPPLYDASLLTDHSGEDWVPIARGFGVTTATVQGEWWTNPFAGRFVPGW